MKKYSLLISVMKILLWMILGIFLFSYLLYEFREYEVSKWILMNVYSARILMLLFFLIFVLFGLFLVVSSFRAWVKGYIDYYEDRYTGFWYWVFMLVFIGVGIYFIYTGVDAMWQLL